MKKMIVFAALACLAFLSGCQTPCNCGYADADIDSNSCNENIEAEA